MLSREENELVTRVEGEAPAGHLMSRYWLPALMSDEIVDPDGTPVHVRLVGQDLVAFRDSRGTLGMIDEACPHRLPSLALGRNEEGGVRYWFRSSAPENLVMLRSGAAEQWPADDRAFPYGRPFAGHSIENKQVELIPLPGQFFKA
jgi:nitrite reductase/ring-hydroxylating ferredoxin subunit